MNSPRKVKIIRIAWAVRQHFTGKSCLCLLFIFTLLSINIHANDQTPIEIGLEFVKQGEEIVRSGGDFDEAKILFSRALKIAKTNSHQTLEILAKHGMGLALYYEGDYQQANTILTEIVPQVPSSEKDLQASINKLHGNNLVYLGNYAKAYEHQLKALEYYKTQKDSSNQAKITFAIGNNFFYQEQFNLALDEFEESLHLWESLKDETGIFRALGAIGSVYEYLDQLDKAIEYSEQALEISYRLNDLSDIAWTLYNIGSIATSSGDLKKAAKNLSTAKELAIELENIPLLGYILEGLAVVYIKLHKYETALKSLDESYSIALKNNDNANLPGLYKLYAEIYFAQKKYPAYGEYIEKYITLKDSLKNEELASTMGDLKKDFEVRELERQKEIELLKKDVKINNFRKLFWAGSFAFFAAVLLFLYFYVSSKNRHVKEKNELLISTNKRILQQNEILKTSNKDLNQYAYIISHDLKEPLRNISSFTTLLKRKASNKLNEDELEFMQFITKGVHQMHSLLSDLLEYSKIKNKSRRVKEIESLEVVRNVLDSLSYKIETTNTKIKIGKLPKVFIEPNHLYQVVLNLVSNGMKFTGDNSPVVEISCATTSAEHIFSIKDNGIGIEEKFHDKIFVVFQRLNNRKKYSGSGIGLSTCKKIINDYGGKIWLKSTPGKGTTFYFSIPISPTETAGASGSKEEKSKSSLSAVN